MFGNWRLTVAAGRKPFVFFLAQPNPIVASFMMSAADISTLWSWDAA